MKVSQIPILNYLETLKTLCYIEVPLDTRFKYIRCNETPIANFYSDLIRAEF
jgi:hypothetical protein